MVFALASLIYAGESKRSQKLIQDKIQGRQPNPSNLKTLWDKTRAYVGVSTKCGVRCQMLVHSLTILCWIIKEPLLCTFFILNGHNLYPSNLR